MPSVPKPSQEKKAKSPKAKKEKVVRPKKERAEKADKAAERKSHYAEIKALAETAGSLTPDEVRKECEQRGLTKKTAGNYVCYLNRDGLVKKAA
jgi:hypothetical protein